MINAINIKSKSDIIGATASSLCFLHCVATPFLFVAHASTVAIEASHPWWWGMLDIFFLIISFFAVYWSARKTSRSWIKYALWSAWLLLTLLIVNEKLELWHFSEEAIYVPAISLIVLHVYNRNFCQCADKK